jgi:hypothetical protein
LALAWCSGTALLLLPTVLFLSLVLRIITLEDNEASQEVKYKFAERVENLVSVSWIAFVINIHKIKSFFSDQDHVSLFQLVGQRREKERL